MHFINCSSSTGPDKDFLYKELLHVNKNSQDFSCILCGKVFSLKSRLSLHIMLVHFKRPQNCKHVCHNKGFPDETGINIHVCSHLGIKPSVVRPHLKSKYRCHLCNKGYPGLLGIKLHVASHLDPNLVLKEFKCETWGDSHKHSQTWTSTLA